MNADSGKSRFLPLPFYKTNRPRAARESRFTIRTHSERFVDSPFYKTNPRSDLRLWLWGRR